MARKPRTTITAIAQRGNEPLEDACWTFPFPVVADEVGFLVEDDDND